jgi:hypothetical protein
MTLKALFKYIWSNGLFAILLYYALVEDVSGAQNVVIFFIWLLTLISLFLTTDDGLKAFLESVQKNGSFVLSSPVAEFIDSVYDVAVLMTLIWYGWIWMGVFYFIHMAAQHGTISKAKIELAKE